MGHRPRCPEGLALTGDTLFVTDIDRLVAIDIERGEISGAWPAEGAQFLNDPAADTDGRPRLWLKATLLHPGAAAADLEALLHAVTAAVRLHPGQPVPPASTSHRPQTARGT